MLVPSKLHPKLLLITAALLVATSAQSQRYSNPVIPGDHPDPTILRDGNEYWATSTSSEWAPIFPLFRSTDLVNWELMGSVFQNPPAWSAGNYWAPELSRFEGKYYVYYAARNRQRRLCVGVATATQVGGPYQDHGPVICQEDGSIDPATATDEKGQRYLIWKEDGNSRHQPTPIWAQPLSQDGTTLTGARRELIRNDARWEGPTVEGPFILQRAGYFYLFYAGGSCCGVNCDYKEGVARSRHLLGPWEKYKANPIVSGNSAWKCPGHGSLVVDQEGRDFFLYHGYPQNGFTFVGREAVLDVVEWGRDGWPRINGGKGPSASGTSPFRGVQKHAANSDEFRSARLATAWEWPWENRPNVTLKGNGEILLQPAQKQSGDAFGATLAQVVPSPHYRASVQLATASVPAGVTAALTGYGDHDDGIGVGYKDGNVLVFRKRRGGTTITAQSGIKPRSDLGLRITVTKGNHYRFSYRVGDGDWKDLQEHVPGSDLPPWDLGVRIALTCGGNPDAKAVFRHFQLETLEGE